jgi:acyl-CoA thioesterase-1
MRGRLRTRRPLISSALVIAMVGAMMSCGGRTEEAVSAPVQAERAPVVMVLGDSFTMGWGPVRHWRSYAGVTARRLGWQLVTAGASGTGYVNKGRVGRTFHDSFMRELSWRPEPDMLIVSGGHNDRRTLPATVRQAAIDLVETARARWPNTRIVLVGPIWMERAPRWAYDVRDSIAGAATLTGVTFLDPLARRWVFDDRESVVLRDGVHPTAAGHARLARWLVEELEANGLGRGGLENAAAPGARQDAVPSGGG